MNFILFFNIFKFRLYGVTKPVGQRLCLALSPKLWFHFPTLVQFATLLILKFVLVYMYPSFTPLSFSLVLRLPSLLYVPSLCP